MILLLNACNRSGTGNRPLFPVCVLSVALALLGDDLNWIPIAREMRRVEGARTNDDIWSMTANMNDDNSGTSRSDYPRANLHKKFKLFDGNMLLDDRSRYLLEWHIDDVKNKVQFALTINTTHENFNIGYDVFGLGFSERGQFVSSDFCLIWFDLSHDIHLQDAITDNEGRLKVIESSESQCKLLESRLDESDTTRYLVPNDNNEEPDGTGTHEEIGAKFHHKPKNGGADLYGILFERPLKVCEPKQHRNYYTIDDGTTHLVWFTLKGPLLSMDNLNLEEMSGKKQPGAHDHKAQAPGSKYADIFDHGMRRVQLWTHKSPSQGKLAQHRTMVHDIHMDKYQVPAQETTYWCKLFKLPSKFENRRYHITRYEALIEPPENHQVVHHMELFNCANLDVDQEIELDRLWTNSGGWSGNCNDKLRPKAMEPCRKVILAWAMGAKPLDYPEQVGQSIGGHDYSPYVVLEVHYNNVNSQAGILDSSGLRFHYTPKLRPFDAGVLEVGLEYSDKNSIPPGMVTPLAGYCVSECTRAAMSASFGELARSSHSSHRNSRAKTLGVFHSGDLRFENDSEVRTSRVERDGQQQSKPGAESLRKISDNTDDAALSSSKIIKQTTKQPLMVEQEGIFIFAAQMHTHLTGVASWTEHVREGRLIGELQRDNHYSPHFQEIRLLKEPVHVVPGDALIHYCLYDTRQRTNVTLGGFATSDEMCVTYLHYYPRIDLEVCKSSVETKALQSYFAYLSEEENQETSGNLLELKTTASKTTTQDKGRARSVADNYNSIKWSPRLAKDLIQFYSEAPLSVQCNRSNGQRFPGFWNGIMPTKLLLPTGDGAVSVSDNHCDGGCGNETQVRPFSSSPVSGQRLVQYRGLHPQKGQIERRLCRKHGQHE